MRTQTIHALLVLLAAIPWAVGVLCFALALLLVLTADWLIPGATWGNCWSFVGPKWAKRGGYIVIRMADDVKVFGVQIIPHAIWLPAWPPDLPVHQTKPLRRSRNPLRTLYFPFRVSTRERPHDSRHGDL